MSRDEVAAVKDAAIAEYIGGKTRREVCAKYGMAEGTLGRWMRERGLRLSLEEVRRRQRRGGQIRSDPRVLVDRTCKPGCKCARHSRHDASSIVMGRKLCGSKYHEGPRWLPIHYFDAQTRDIDGEPIAFQSWCKACNRIAQRIRVGVKRTGKPYQKRRQRMSHQERLERKRQRYHELKKDPQWLARRREYQRFYAEALRRAAGVPPRTVMFENRLVEVENGKANGERLDPQPLVDWIKRRSLAYGSTLSLASVIGVNEKALRRYVSGETRSVNEALVDSWLTIEGTTHIVELYPELYS